jgi:hypothetical protein
MEDIKIVMLKNGHHIITKINELFVEGKEEPFCFLFTAPLVITYKSTDNQELELSFTLWSPFSKSVEFRIPFDHVVSMGEPKDDILEKYMEIAGPLFEKLEEVNEPEEELIEEDS